MTTTTIELLPLVRSRVPVGKPLPWSIRDSEGHLLLRRGQVVPDAAHLELLIERGATVGLEEARAAARELRSSTLAAASARPFTANVFDHWAQLLPRLKRAVHSIHLGAEFRTGIDAIARDVIGLTTRYPDMGIFLAVRQDQANHIDYGYTHSVQAAMVCVLLANHLGWRAAETETLVRAALTMNLTIADLQGRMAGQDYPMLDRQRMQIRAHPAQAAALLAHAGVDDPAWLEAVADHHEHVDGTGYPHGKLEVGRPAQALRLVDVFTAKLTPRLIRSSLSPREAEKAMYLEGQAAPATMDMVVALIKEFGIYPPGDLVRLHSGEIGVVVQRGALANTPVVATLTDTHGRHSTSTFRRNTAESAFSITGPVVDKSLVERLPPQRVYGYGLES